MLPLMTLIHILIAAIIVLTVIISVVVIIQQNAADKLIEEDEYIANLTWMEIQQQVNKKNRNNR